MADLTTLDAVKTWQGKLASSNTSGDAVLQSLITSTSADFLRAIQRPDLMQNQYTENRVGDGSRRLVLRHWPVTSVASLMVGAVEIPQQASPTDGWYLDTGVDPERAFVLYLSGALAFTDGAAVPITYVAGYDATPSDIVQAVTEWVAYRYTKKQSTGQTQARSVEGENAHFEEFDIPPNTKRVIAAYKRKFAAYGVDPADSGIGADGSLQVTVRQNRAAR
jgi:hypothetical protein